MADVRELGRKVKAKYPGKYDDLSDDDLGRKVKAKYPGAYDDFTDAPTQQPEGVLSSFQTGVAGPLLRNVVETAADFYNAPGETLERAGRGGAPIISALGGRPELAGQAFLAGQIAQAAPLAELNRRADERLPEPIQSMKRGMAAEEAKPRTRAGRIAGGVGSILGEAAFPTAPESAVASIITAPAAGAAAKATGQAFKAGVNAVRRTFGKGAAQIVEAEALPAATARVQESIGEAPTMAAEANPTVQGAISQFEEAVQRINASNLSPAQKARELDAAITAISREARGMPPSLPGESMVQSRYPRGMQAPPMRMPGEPLGTVTGFEPVPGTPASRGALPPRGANLEIEPRPPALEADLGPQSFGVKAADDLAFTETAGPPMSAPMDLNAAVGAAADEVPRGFAQKAKDELLGTLGAFKSLRSTGDASYPLRQGALLLLRPLQWRQAGKVWAANFKAFKTKNFEAIKEAIDTHQLAGRMESAGLKPFTQSGEEAFAKRAGSKVSEVVNKLPVLKHSEQAYSAAAATQRVQAFEQYSKLIDKAGLTPEEALKADKAAAEWINIATGRGSLGQRIDKAFEALNFAFFSPRYVASRLNLFNPAMYIRNASSPGGRVVLKQQMSDLMQFASVAATTMYLAKQAGADVGLNPNSPDFLKIRFGDTRYDMGAGLTQVMRLIYRVGADIGRAGRGEKPKPGQSATDIAETFLSYKLSPPAGVFRDFIKQRTVDRKGFSVGGAARDLVVPMQWADFVEAYQKEAWGGVAKSLPGAVGVGVQRYESAPVQAAIDKVQPLFSELKRLNKRVSDLRKKDGEKDEAFNARVQQFSANYTRFGQQLLNSPRFQSAPDAVKAIALDALNSRAKAITSRELGIPEIELDANILMDAAESSKKNAARK